jgi:hypothetical protein
MAKSVANFGMQLNTHLVDAEFLPDTIVDRAYHYVRELFGTAMGFWADASQIKGELEIARRSGRSPGQLTQRLGAVQRKYELAMNAYREAQAKAETLSKKRWQQRIAQAEAKG